MTLELSSFPTAEETKTFSAPTDYRTKVDAKIAVACLAAEQGAVEFLRFRGGPPPPGYQTFHSALINGAAHAPNKRKDRDDDGPQERKKSKMDMKEGDRHVLLLETKDEAMGRLSCGRSSRPSQSRDNRTGNNGGRRNPHGPASSGFCTISRPVQGPPIGQIRSGSRTVSDSTLNYGVSEPLAPAAPPAPSRPDPQVSAALPGPSRTGPVMLGMPGHYSPFTPVLQGRPGDGGPQVAPPEPSPFAPRPPAQSFLQAGQYPSVGFLHTPPIAGYYPSGIPPYAFPQQYPGTTTGPTLSSVPPPPPSPRYPPPYASPAAPSPPYGAYPSTQFPQPQQFPPPQVPLHMYHSQYQQPHSPYPNTPGLHLPGISPVPMPNSGTNWAPGYDIPLASAIPAQPPYNVDTRQPSHNPQNPPAPIPVQAKKSTGEHPVIKMSQPSYQLKSPTNDLQPSDEDTQLRVTSAPEAKSHVASLLGTSRLRL